MKVLFIAHSHRDSYLPFSGGFIYEQALALQKNGNDVSMVAVNLISLKSIVKYKKIDFGYREFSDNQISQMVYQIPSIPFMKGLNRWIRNKLLIRLIKKNITKNGLPQIAHVHVFYSGKAAIWLKNKHSIPYIITEHFSVFAQKLSNKNELAFAQNVYKNAASCIGVSNIFCEYISRKFNIEFNFVPNTVNVDLFEISKEKEMKSEIRLISVGSLTKNKNHEMLIRAIAKVSANVRLQIVGDGILKQHLQNLVMDLGLEDKISFFGLATQQELVLLLQKSDIFVLSSKYETFGVVIIEAMACGLPIVSTLCGGPQSIITDSSLGELCKQTEKDLAHTIDKVINTKYDANLIRDYVIQNYASKAFAQKIECIYKSVIQSSEVEL